MTPSQLPVLDTPAPSFFGLSRDRLRESLLGHGLPGFRAEQMYSWVYQKHVRDPLGMTNLPLAFRRSLPGVCDLALPETASVHKSADERTHKFVLKLADGARVESVSMRTPKRLTFCISSQVGCALGCTFCATGLMGLKRNLKAHEIVAQVMAMGEFHGWRDDRFNIVYMGMGEPLANLAAVAESIRVLHDERGLNLGARRVTVSTSGLVPQIRQLAKLELQLGLAISLHATTDELRDQLGAGEQALAHPRAAGRGEGVRPHGGPPGHDRVHAAGRRERLHGRRRPAGRVCARAAEQGEPDPLQPGPRARLEAPDTGRHRGVRRPTPAARPRGDRAPDAGRRDLGRVRPVGRPRVVVCGPCPDRSRCARGCSSRC
jgi:hypothetical protein